MNPLAPSSWLRGIRLLATVLSVSAAVRVSAALDVPPRITHVFLLIGQSNMAGRGPLDAESRVTHPRVFALDKEKTWVPATDPLHFDKPDIAGVGPGLAFGKAIADAHPDWVVGLVPAAFGGTSIDQWRAGGKLYGDAVARTRAALASGAHLAGILWIQGESDNAPAKAAAYGAKFGAMITRLRADLNAADVPVFVGEIGRFGDAAPLINPQLARLPAAVPRCVLVTAEGLTDKGDRLHFDTKSAREYGRRFAAAYLRLAP